MLNSSSYTYVFRSGSPITALGLRKSWSVKQKSDDREFIYALEEPP